MSEQHRLVGAGLPNVYLANGYTITGEGEDREICIRNIDGLYAAIAEALCMSTATLTPAELRFLRKRLEVSQEALGAQLGKTSQAVAKWEKSETTIPVADSVMIKMLWLQRCRPQMSLAKAPLDASTPTKDRYVFEISAVNTWAEQLQPRL
jgi:DNA-binding transcriptional regulator YiaG